MDFSRLFKILVETPDAFGENEAKMSFEFILQGNCSDLLVGSFLTALKITKVDRRPEIVAAVAHQMRAHSLKIDSQIDKLVDIVGTGGDGKNTFNVSTAAGLVVAGAGCRVAKHGNRASSSSCGSADILEALNAKISSISPEKLSAHFNSSDSEGTFCFLFSQTFHPAMKHVAQIRKQLGIKTIFNILGPMINPAKPRRMIVGVSTKDLGKLMAEALLLDSIEFAWVVHGELGLDEISCEGKTMVWEVNNGSITEKKISPSDFGIQEHDLSLVVGGNAAHNANIMTDLLNGKLRSGPILDFVLINAAALLYVSGTSMHLRDGVAMAKKAIFEGNALNALKDYVELTK